MALWLSLTLALGALLGGLLLLSVKQEETPTEHPQNEENLPPDLLSAIREMRSDMDTGKLSPQEFEDQKAALMSELPKLLALKGKEGPLKSGKVSLPFVLILIALVMGSSAAFAWQREQARLEAEVVAKKEFKKNNPANAGIPPEIMAMVDSLKAKLAKNPKDFEGQMMLGRSMVQLGRLSEAKDAFMAAGKLDPISPHPLAGLGKLLMASQDPEAAAMAFDSALQRDPNDQESLYFRAMIYYQHENAPDKALPLVKSLITIIKDSPEFKAGNEDAQNALTQLNDWVEKLNEPPSNSSK